MIVKHISTSTSIEKLYEVITDEGTFFYKEWEDESGRVLDFILKDENGTEYESVQNYSIISEIQEQIDNNCL